MLYGGSNYGKDTYGGIRSFNQSVRRIVNIGKSILLTVAGKIAALVSDKEFRTNLTTKGADKTVLKSK